MAETSPVSVETCTGCSSEFMVGAKFCHVCGSSRQTSAAPKHWTNYLEFHTIAQGFGMVRKFIGLPLPSLIALMIGAFCFLAALAVGMIYSVQTNADFQAVQLYRVQWLLAAVAAFVAGILLRRSGVNSEK